MGIAMRNTKSAAAPGGLGFGSAKSPVGSQLSNLIMPATPGIEVRKQLPFLDWTNRSSTLGKKRCLSTTLQKFEWRWRRQNRAETSMSSFALDTKTRAYIGSRRMDKS